MNGFFDRKEDVRKLVVLEQNALIKANVYAGMTRKLQGPIEVMGFLLGTRTSTELRIVDAVIGDCESGPASSEMGAVTVLKIKQAAKERSLEMVGQWHYHPDMSPEPSSIDDEFMIHFEKFGAKFPVQLITNLEEFTLTIMHSGKRYDAFFIVPPKQDTYLGISLDYTNHAADAFSWLQPEEEGGAVAGAPAARPVSLWEDCVRLWHRWWKPKEVCDAKKE